MELSRLQAALASRDGSNTKPLNTTRSHTAHSGAYLLKYRPFAAVQDCGPSGGQGARESRCERGEVPWRYPAAFKRTEEAYTGPYREGWHCQGCQGKALHHSLCSAEHPSILPSWPSNKPQIVHYAHLRPRFSKEAQVLMASDP